MTGWHNSLMVGFDLETTGIDLENDRVITACMALIRPGHEPDIRSCVVDPGIEVSEAAAAVHGYTTERVRVEGKDPAVELDWVTADLAAAVRAGVPIVGMNCVFDFTILDRECRRLGLPTIEDRAGGPIRPVIDVYVIDRAIDRYRKGKRKLTDLCEFYGARNDSAHDSTEDALAAARVAWRLGQRSHMDPEAILRMYSDRKYPNDLVRAFRALRSMSPADLHTAQINWYREQTESFRSYLQREAEQKRHDAANADTDEARAIAEQEAAELDARIDSLSPHWPIRPHTEQVPMPI